MTEFFCFNIFGINFAVKVINLTQKSNEKNTTTLNSINYLKF